MNPIQEALRGTQETIRYIGQDQASNKRMLAESKLLGAQMEYKQAAAENDMAYKKETQRLARDKFELVKEQNKDISFKEILSYTVTDPDKLAKISEAFEKNRPGILEKKVNPKLVQSVYDNFLKQNTPKATSTGDFQKGDVVETDPTTGRKTVIRKAPIPKDRNNYITLTKEQKASLGIAENLFAQQDKYGKVTVQDKGKDKTIPNPNSSKFKEKRLDAGNAAYKLAIESGKTEEEAEKDKAIGMIEHDINLIGGKIKYHPDGSIFRLKDGKLYNHFNEEVPVEGNEKPKAKFDYKVDPTKFESKLFPKSKDKKESSKKSDDKSKSDEKKKPKKKMTLAEKLAERKKNPVKTKDWFQIAKEKLGGKGSGRSSQLIKDSFK